MGEPNTLSTLGAVALTEGIKFLYSQAGEILKRWRERQELIKEDSAQLNQNELVQVNLPPTIFEEQFSALKIHFDLVQQSEKELRALRKDLTDYVEGIESVDEKDENLLKIIDALRKLLEVAYQQRLTFKGEPRTEQNPIVSVEMELKKVLGYAAAAREVNANYGTFNSIVDVDEVGEKGRVFGIDVVNLG